MQTIRVTQTTEIEVSDVAANQFLREINQHGLPIHEDFLTFFGAKVKSRNTTITRPVITISDLEKSGEII